MPSPHTSSTLEYALIAIVVCVAAVTLATALWPMVELIVDGFQILGQVFSGSFVPLK